MDLESQNRHPVGFGVPISVPSSFKGLPQPRFPSTECFTAVRMLQGSLVKKEGIAPSTYAAVDSELFHRVKAVYSGLMNALISELSVLDLIDLSVELYRRHEEYLGSIRKQELAIDSRTEGNSAATEKYRLWERMSHFTTATRWLIEVTVKCCNSPGFRPNREKLDYLIALAVLVVDWDGVWEHIFHGVMPYELVVGPDSTVSSRQTPRTAVAYRAYEKALAPYEAEFTALQAQSRKETVTIEMLMESPETKILNNPVKIERGYSMEDWLHFSSKLIDSFAEREYFKIARDTRFAKLPSQSWELPTDRLKHLLTDYGLSKETLADLDLDELHPVEHARRDSRLLRRPIVILERNGKVFYLYGIETLIAGLQIFWDRLPAGRVQLPEMRHNGPVRKAIGKIQTHQGDFFRDEICGLCTDASVQNVKEKAGTWNDKIPQSSGFGPVDVFVIDRKNCRFVLAEVKDVGDEGVDSKLMKRELKEFLKFVRKLELQRTWFEDRLEALKAEFGVKPEQYYSVEGVIVINRPRLWMYTHTEVLPIVDFRRFFKILRLGGEFVTRPVPL